MLQNTSARSVYGQVLSGSSERINRSLLNDYGMAADTVDSVSFSLFSYHGDIINSREDVDVTVTAGEFTIILSGDDFPAPSNYLFVNKEVLQIKIVQTIDAQEVTNLYEEWILVKKSHEPSA